jgi:hypothetical protein
MLAYVSWTRNVGFAFPRTTTNELKTDGTNADSQNMGDGVRNVQRSVQQLAAGKQYRPAIGLIVRDVAISSMAEQLFCRSPTRERRSAEVEGHPRSVGKAHQPFGHPAVRAP